MRGLLVWLLGAAVAFFLTAGAFLLLANLGSNATESNLDPRSPSEPQSLMEIVLQRDQLSDLRPLQDQRLSFRIENGSESNFSRVSVTIRVSSDNTAFGESRYYRAQVENLRAGESKPVRSRIDLSSFEPERQSPGSNPENPEDEGRIILEIQATTPEGISSVRTAILPA